MRVIHNLAQGSSAWQQHRALIFNASEAPMLMGVSKYGTRSDLLQQKATGIAPEVNAAKQALFDRGHAVETPTIEMIEEDIGEGLAPIVASLEIDGLSLGASYDGLAMLEDTAAEVKLWNESLAQQIRRGELEPHYYWQLEQQFIVTPSLERIIFATSDGTRERFVSMEYRPVPGRREQLIAAWKQFAADLAAYKPQAAAEVVTAAPIEALPALSVQMQGSLAVHSNLDVFGVKLREFIARIPAKPDTEQEFADCDAACKALKRAEEALDGAEANALGQVQSVEQVTRMISDLRSVARTARLASEKMVKARKEQIRTEEVQRGKDALSAHIDALNRSLGQPWMPPMMGTADFGAAISGKKTLDSVRNAIDTELSRAKIATNETAERIRANREDLKPGPGGIPGDDWISLFPDFAQVCTKAPEDFRNLRIARVEAERQRREAERERIRAEEQAKAEKAAREKVEREQREQEAARQAELRREQQASEAAKPVQPIAAAPIAQPALSSQAQNVVSLRSPADPGATIRLGEIGELLGFTLNADFIASLGFRPVATVKQAKLYRLADFDLICDALIAHVSKAKRAKAA